MSYQEAYQEPYTMYPNRYLDYIAPKLSSTERDVAEVIIRYTKGYHVASAQIPNRVFMSRTGKSEPTIIKAKKSLIDLGLLVVLNDGGGTTTTEYMIDLYYNNPTKSIKAQLDRQQEELDEFSIEDERLGVQNDIIIIESDTTDTPPQPIELDSQESDTTHDVSSTTDAIVIEPDVEVHDMEPEVDHPSSTSSTTDAPTMEVGAPSPTIATISDTHVPTESIITDSNAIPTTKVSLVPSYKDLDLSIININKKHTEAATSTVTTTTRAQITALRCLFSDLFPGTGTEGDYGFWGYLAKTYGIDRCMDKINYMGEHRRHHPINNPKGFLRRALECNYSPPLSIVAKLKADESARRATERSRMEAQEWEARVQSHDYEASTAELQKLMATLN